MHPTFTRRRLLAGAAVCAGLLAPLTTSHAQTAAAWPSKPLRFIVGFPAGSSPDLTARALAEPLEKALGQPVVVENRVGAGGNIGGDAVAKATDGHTIGLMINGNLTIARLLNPALRYDPATDFAPISLIGVAPLVLVAPASAPGSDARSFLDAARAAGSKWSYGSPGVGTVGHLGMELLKARTGIAPVHVPYPGYPQVFNALVGGDLQLSMLPPALAQTQIKAGKLRGIGVTGSGRSPLAPELPSLLDAGVKQFNLEIWNAVVAPAGMPRAHVARLAEAISTIVRAPEMRQRLFQQGWQAVGSSPEGLANRIQADTRVLGQIIRTQGIRVD
ncbi:MAG TPA: tripartite tricarboxylate transporter substrate binding protein [Ottowia sp.]|uniref:Bug family tripartite tricarboxylate transporter substrate binding protein n=1 Tax=Ottowia sp. TaxID=1898956 RepID=UPI002B591161|nr:tripartite tricarboxylate transporter substrate binding protein [Ottowia sp.]HNI85231.1 tripartite tricarboxylate transporter substrate binding protein [Ottowia sp.]HNJ46414.1 tripartite tricarboxylate transporter substrate binding protein [Ottowia sp.]HNK52415.1 tripartite tricarboxylate transporter substrate binding protein [Ottowia sp.]HNR83475.1 tripartite tricarboxylate transporter substrate binding protein [Ottowia sp.]HNT84777.1 tripartite tricarboxylate transporter substrate binding